jgi:hypothetical protein
MKRELSHIVIDTGFRPGPCDAPFIDKFIFFLLIRIILWRGLGEYVSGIDVIPFKKLFIDLSQSLTDLFNS